MIPGDGRSEMIYTPMTKRAMRLMFEAHKDQVDKGGVPYVFHPWHVAESMPDEMYLPSPLAPLPCSL